MFPLYHGCPWRFASLEAAPQSNPQLTVDAKQILRRTHWEADFARDYWIDTEHLLLGNWARILARLHNISQEQV